MISCLGWIPKATMMAVPAVAGPPPGEGDRISRPPRGGASSGDSSGDDEPADASDGMAVEREGGEGRDAELARAMAVAAEMGAKSAAAMEKDDVEGRGVGGGEGDPLAELDMDHYDSSGDEEPVVARIMRSRQGGEMAPDEDPYMEFGDASDEEDSDADDWAFRPGDLVIPATKVEEEIYSLELWVYEEADDDDAGNLYVHHDLMLPAFPLSLAWMDVKPNMGGEDKANIVAVGSMEPGIELWDIDVVDSVEPVATLDVEGKKRKKKKRKDQPEGHNATLGLSWNASFRNVLASAGADKRVRVWDVAAGACEHTLKHHTKKVQSVAWNPAEGSVLLSGSFDKSVCMVDVRVPDGNPLRWELSADSEALCWSAGNPTAFVASSEDGMVVALDARGGAGSSPLYRLAAHEKPTTCLGFCPAVPNLLMTASVDKQVKLWDVSNNQPGLVASEAINAGAIFAATFCGPDFPFLIAAGGDKGSLVVWDTLAVPAVAKRCTGAARPKVYESQE